MKARFMQGLEEKLGNLVLPNFNLIMFRHMEFYYAKGVGLRGTAPNHEGLVGIGYEGKIACTLEM